MSNKSTSLLSIFCVMVVIGGISAFFFWEGRGYSCLLVVYQYVKLISNRAQLASLIVNLSLQVSAATAT